MNMNLNNYYSTHISKDNIYDEFIIVRNKSKSKSKKKFSKKI